jgi:hypothetical protein
MSDELIIELIAAMVAARADGDGVLTIAAVRTRLADAKIELRRVEDDNEPRPPIDDDETDFTQH